MRITQSAPGKALERQLHRSAGHLHSRRFRNLGTLDGYRVMRGAAARLPCAQRVVGEAKESAWLDRD